MWCLSCDAETRAEANDADGFTCCTVCGRVLDDTVFSTDPTFSKTAGGVSQVDGNFVPASGATASLGRGPRGARVFGYQGDSHEKTLAKGKQEIQTVADRLGIHPREEAVAAAHRLYKLAVSRNFTRGRRTGQVAGACLYIWCRQESRPYMLIDFSDKLQTNVYVLGAVFLQLCRLLRLESTPMMTRPIDPALYIHRFADRLGLGSSRERVTATALRLVASMKRDWMQTGRRPAGVCGAALFAAAHLHGHPRSKKDIIAVVHVGEGTLTKRLSEFGDTPAGGLTHAQFEGESLEAAAAEQEHLAALTAAAGDGGDVGRVTCEHRGVPGVTHFLHGMCRDCFVDFTVVAGGARGGADPPAFAKPSSKRLRLEAAAARAALTAGVVTPTPGATPIPGETPIPGATPTAGGGQSEEDAFDAALASESLAPLLRAAAGGAMVVVGGAGVVQRGGDGGEEGGEREEEGARGGAGQGGGQGGRPGRLGGIGGGLLTMRPPPPVPRPTPPPPTAPAAPIPPAAPAAPARPAPGNIPGQRPVSETEADGAAPHADGESLSDVDDADVAKYLHTPEEAQAKGRMWTELNADYLEKKAARDAVAAERAAAVAEAAGA